MSFSWHSWGGALAVPWETTWTKYQHNKKAPSHVSAESLRVASVKLNKNHAGHKPTKARFYDFQQNYNFIMYKFPLKYYIKIKKELMEWEKYWNCIVKFYVPGKAT